MLIPTPRDLVIQFLLLFVTFVVCWFVVTHLYHCCYPCVLWYALVRLVAYDTARLMVVTPLTFGYFVACDDVVRWFFGTYRRSDGRLVWVLVLLTLSQFTTLPRREPVLPFPLTLMPDWCVTTLRFPVPAPPARLVL